jgi:hypothetical protein
LNNLIHIHPVPQKDSCRRIVHLPTRAAGVSTPQHAVLRSTVRLNIMSHRLSPRAYLVSTATIGS